MLFDLHPKLHPEELYGREREVEEVVRLVKLGNWVLVLGPRMVGKTSLMRTACSLLEKEGFRTAYINLWGVKGSAGFLTALVESINSVKGIFDKLKEAILNIEELSVGTSGIQLKTTRKPLSTAWKLLSAIGRLKDRWLVVLDEVQELAAISAQLHKLLANVFNSYPNIIFIFSGSMFGLIKTLLNPSQSSPLYGRKPTPIKLQHFTRKQALDFLRRGFMELRVGVNEDQLADAVDRLGTSPGWLTLYGNYAAVQRLNHEEAVDEVIKEGVKIMKAELEHYLEDRDRETHLAVLKACLTPATWTEIKKAVERKKGYQVNDATIQSTLQELQAAMLIEKTNKTYMVMDPMLKALLTM
ncbi:MAG: ATP-binding protein [Thermoprotei archaeon]|nr:MAG: ATP-binding protein [Thermoprotei archaeon]RLF17797.1 MAG: ATP-binding protein [Thermoprotei archaeon]